MPAKSFSGSIVDLNILIISVALLLDLLIGDPVFLPHPIRVMGKAVSFSESFFRKLPFNLIFSGVLFTFSLVAIAWIITLAVTLAAGSFHPAAKIIVEIIIIYYSISVKSLKDCAMKVYVPLKAGSIEEAKEKLSEIVGRDVSGLDEKGVIRACVETVAENLVDGVISPIFFAAIGGAPMAMAFKMISTLDSMVGYKNEKYIKFGKASARLDDIANFVPARISIFIISIASYFLNKNGWITFKTSIFEGSSHSSPNAGYPEAAFAGALDIKLGGPNYYQGRLVEKPFIGIKSSDAETDHIKKANQLMVLTSILFMGLCLIFTFLKVL